MKIGELIPTLTGFEELGIEQVCGKALEEIVDTGTKDRPRPGRDILLARVMGAVVIARRDNQPTLTAAWQKVLRMTQAELADLFPDDTEDEIDDVLEDDVTTESGKGESETESALTSSQPSSSTPG